MGRCRAAGSLRSLPSARAPLPLLTPLGALGRVPGGGGQAAGALRTHTWHRDWTGTNPPGLLGASHSRLCAPASGPLLWLFPLPSHASQGPPSAQMSSQGPPPWGLLKSSTRPPAPPLLSLGHRCLPPWHPPLRADLWIVFIAQHSNQRCPSHSLCAPSLQQRLSRMLFIVTLLKDSAQGLGQSRASHVARTGHCPWGMGWDPRPELMSGSLRMELAWA